MTDLSNVGKLIVFAGAGLVLLGLLLIVAGRFSFFGHLPGDIVYHRGRFTLIAPIATTLLLSIILTLILNLVIRR
jgi:hypothetical protein